MLAFTLSLDDVVIASFTTGPGSATLPIRIYSEVRLGVKPQINAICTLFIGLDRSCHYRCFVRCESCRVREGRARPRSKVRHCRRGGIQFEFQTADTRRTHSRGGMRPRFACRLSTSKIQREQGMPDARCTRGLACKTGNQEKRTRAYRFSGGHPTFPAQWFYGLLRDLPGEPSSIATVASPNRSPAKLGASVGRQNHATSPSAQVTLVSRNFRVHRIPPHVRDDSRSAPLIG